MDKNIRTTSTRPYLIRAWHEWCTDNGLTPYVTVRVDRSVQVPAEYVKDKEIVLNIGFEATTGLTIGNEYLEFKARFGGVPRDIWVPVGNVMAIFARETSQGMAFPVVEEPTLDASLATDASTSQADGPRLSAVVSVPQDSTNTSDSNSTADEKPASRPTLTRIK